MMQTTTSQGHGIRWRWTLAIVVLLLGRLAIAGDSIALGPYVQNVTSESAVICWSTLEEEIVLGTASGAMAQSAKRGFCTAMVPHHRASRPSLRGPLYYYHPESLQAARISFVDSGTPIR